MFKLKIAFVRTKSVFGYPKKKKEKKKLGRKKTRYECKMLFAIKSGGLARQDTNLILPLRYI